MANWPARDRASVGTLSRRRLLSTLAVATSAALFSPLQDGPRPVSAQSPVATPGAMVSNTLAADSSTRFRAVAEALMAAMTATGTPGAALGILADGREVHATFGMDRVEGGVPVTADTLFQIGSITKTFTGTAVMRLVDEGALDLDATVRTYLPDLRLENEDVAARVTLRHLLTHTGGWWGVDAVDVPAVVRG
jgi:CubicO group peptidase (beta-lactamase class C family)